MLTCRIVTYRVRKDYPISIGRVHVAMILAMLVHLERCVSIVLTGKTIVWIVHVVHVITVMTPVVASKLGFKCIVIYLLIFFRMNSHSL